MNAETADHWFGSDDVEMPDLAIDFKQETPKFGKSTDPSFQLRNRTTAESY
jgi:hypothetical protein